MTQNGGEKELILGNKQLISLFFVVVALCGVFFAMGYMVRGNSQKAASLTTSDSTTPAPAESVKRQQPEPPAETAEAPAGSTESAPSSETTQPPVETRPVQDSGAAGASAEVKADAKPVRTETPAAVAEIETGATYVQVGALARADAEATVRTLREQHMPAVLAASSKEGTYRVLVGPYHLTSDVADAKAQLKKLGFSDTIVRKQ